MSLSTFETKSLRNNPARRNLPVLSLTTAPGSAPTLPPMTVKTLKRKNLRGLSIGENPPVSQKRNLIQMVTTLLFTPVDTEALTTLELAMASLSCTGETKQQVLTTRTMTSDDLAEGFCFNNFREQDLLRLGDLGAGNLGLVLKVLHTPSQKTMAKKTIHIENDAAVKRQIVRELRIMNECKLKYVVEFYGLFLQEGNVVICMEYLDLCLLDKVLKLHGPFPEYITSHVAYLVLNGLKYLYTQHKIIHRDIKPLNVLLNLRGALKLCDFGVLRELINLVADTFVGTLTYMLPERILGAKYTIKGDIWSLGLMLVELATGFFPFGDTANIAPAGILDLLQRIVNEPPPDLRLFNQKHAEGMPPQPLYPSHQGGKMVPETARREVPYYPFSENFAAFVDKCLIKEELQRLSPSDLLKEKFVTVYKKDLLPEQAKDLKADIKEWCKGVKKLKREAGSD